MSDKLWAALGPSANRVAKTDESRLWLDKALHPASAHTCAGIPDLANVPVAMVNYQSSFALDTSDLDFTGTDVYDADVRMLPHPVIFGTAMMTNSNGSSPDYFLNSQLTGAGAPESNEDIYTRSLAFQHLGPNARMCYHSTTIYFDSASLTNQGQLTAVQYRPPRDEGVLSEAFGTAPAVPYGVVVLTSSGGPPVELQARSLVETLSTDPADFPSYENAITYPTAVSWEAKNGVYMITKLVTPDLEFQPIKADKWLMGFGPVTANDFEGYRTTGYLNGSDSWIFLRNIHKSTNIRIVVRMGVEVALAPGSSLSPYVHMSPAVDWTALESYQLISRGMKDGYPSDHNDLGKVVNVIGRIAREVLPRLSPVIRTIPFVGDPLATMADMAKYLPDRIAKEKVPKRQGATQMAIRQVMQRSLANAQSTPNSFKGEREKRKLERRRNLLAVRQRGKW